MQLKDRIVEESINLFSRRGFAATSIGDIMEASSVSKGGLYNHFRNKEELCLAVLAEARRVWRGINLEGLRETASPLGKVVRLLENYRDRYLPDSAAVPGGCIFVRVSLESSELARHWPRLAKDLATGFSRFKAMLKGYLDQARATGELMPGTDTVDMTDMIFTGMMGASVIYSMDRSRRGMNRNINSLINYIDSSRTGSREEAS